MSYPLTQDNRMECTRHGEGLGFIEAEKDPDPDFPFKQAWCGDCDAVLTAQGEWNDISEGHAQVMAICEGCYGEVQKRNA
jgi:hypothetical protein